MPFLERVTEWGRRAGGGREPPSLESRLGPGPRPGRPACWWAFAVTRSWTLVGGQDPGTDAGRRAGDPVLPLCHPLSAHGPPARPRGPEVPVDLTWALGPRQEPPPRAPGSACGRQGARSREALGQLLNVLNKVRALPTAPARAPAPVDGRAGWEPVHQVREQLRAREHLRVMDSSSRTGSQVAPVKRHRPHVPSSAASVTVSDLTHPQPFGREEAKKTLTD